MRCPYCSAPIEKKLEYAILPERERKMVDAVVGAGAAGLSKAEFVKAHFREFVSPVTVRTTLNRVNKRIAPLRIVTKFGILRVG
jgi:hypothetical protein